MKAFLWLCFATTKNEVCPKCKGMQTHFILQVVILWVFDPENADPNELKWTASEPSLVGGKTIIIDKIIYYISFLRSVKNLF